MKKRFITWFIIGILISFTIGYIVGHDKNTLTKGEYDCLIGNNTDENILISANQAMCLASKEEVIAFYGIGNPFYETDGFIRLKLKSNNMILVEDIGQEFQEKLESLGVYRVSI